VEVAVTLARVVLLWLRSRPRGEHRTAGGLFPASASGLRSPDFIDTPARSEYDRLI